MEVAMMKSLLLAVAVLALAATAADSKSRRAPHHQFSHEHNLFLILFPQTGGVKPKGCDEAAGSISKHVACNPESGAGGSNQKRR
jgi:hypothetical protein